MRLAVLLIIGIVLSGIAYAEINISSLSVSNCMAGATCNVTISNSMNHTNNILNIKRAQDKLYSQILFNGTSVTIPRTKLSSEGIYYFFVNNSEGRFPVKDTKVALSYGLEPILIKARNMVSNDQSSAFFCKPYEGSYACMADSMQADLISGFIEAYAVTKNESYKDIANALSVANFDNDIGESTCNGANKDFNCSQKYNAAYGNITGAKRQASMILALWRSYEITRNMTIYSLGENYTNGSCQECNVWAGDFECGNAFDQGLMSKAYFMAYYQTGKDIYKEIAVNLSQIALTYGNSISIMDALFDGYTLTGNESYLSKAKNISDNLKDLCILSNCSPDELSRQVMGFFKAYESTGEYDYKRAAIDKLYANTNSSCDAHTQDFICDNPTMQGLYASSLFFAYRRIENLSAAFYAPRIVTNRSVREDLELSIKFIGNISRANLSIRHTSGSYTHFNISRNGSVIVTGASVSSQGIYEFYFEDINGARFPFGNGSLKLAITSGSDKVKSKALSLAKSSAAREYCMPYENANSSSCNFEHMQAAMINAYSMAYFVTANQSFINISERLCVSEIDTNPDILGADPNGLYATCDHADNDFDCNESNQNLINNALKKKGAYRQGAMIQSLSTAFGMGYNNSVLQLMNLYAEGSSEDCDVWSGDFDCGSSDEQGYMSYAYWKLFEQTGSLGYKSIAISLSENAFTYNDSALVGIALFKGYELTGNESYLTNALLITNTMLNDCRLVPGCSATRQSLQIMLFWQAYKLTQQSSYLSAAIDKTLTQRMASYCDPNDPNEDKFQCREIDEQGLMIEAFFTAASLYPGTEQSFATSIFANSSFALNATLNLTCVIYPTSDNAVVNITAAIYLSDGLNTTSNLSYHYDNLTQENNITLRFNFSASKGLPQNVECAAWVYNGSYNSSSHKIEVNQIGDVFNLSLNYTRPILIYENESIVAIITNGVGYALKNITITLESEGILNHTSVRANHSIVTGSVSNASINITTLAAYESVFVNWTVIGTTEANFTLNLTLTSLYGGYDQIKENTSTKTTPIDTNHSFPAEVIYQTEFSINISIFNNQSYSINNLTLEINKSSNISFSNITSTLSGYDMLAENNTIRFESVSPNQSIVVKWFFIPLNLSSETLNLSIYSNKGGRIRTMHSFNVLKEPVLAQKNYDSDVAFGTSGEGTIILLNNGSFVLYNLTCEFMSNMTFNITSFEHDSDLVVSANNASFNKSRVNVSENLTINFTYISRLRGRYNLTFRASSTDGANTTAILEINSFYCGDGRCNSNENQASCSADCGSASSTGGGGGGGGGGFLIDEKNKTIVRNITEGKNESIFSNQSGKKQETAHTSNETQTPSDADESDFSLGRFSIPPLVFYIIGIVFLIIGIYIYKEHGPDILFLLHKLKIGYMRLKQRLVLRLNQISPIRRITIWLVSTKKKKRKKKQDQKDDENNTEKIDETIKKHRLHDLISMFGRLFLTKKSYVRKREREVYELCTSAVKLFKQGKREKAFVAYEEACALLHDLKKVNKYHRHMLVQGHVEKQLENTKKLFST